MAHACSRGLTKRYERNTQTFAGLAEDEIRKIKKPILIIVGDEPIHPKEFGEWLGQNLPNAILSMVSGEDVDDSEGRLNKSHPGN